nr:DHH family phosphoesterase [Pseudobdellovibrionaceae bacterium]
MVQNLEQTVPNLISFVILFKLDKLLDSILIAKKIILSTHKQCDGDGLGSQLALYYALKSIQKEVRIVNVDETPRKYRFLKTDDIIEIFEKNPDLSLESDLCLIFDTNDERLLEPLFAKLKFSSKEIGFVDHHPLLIQGPQPTEPSWIAPESASTGEMAYNIIKALHIPLNEQIAKCLYTS